MGKIVSKIDLKIGMRLTTVILKHKEKETREMTSRKLSLTLIYNITK